MIDLNELCWGTGYAIRESEHDTANIICHRGHIYADGDWLVASIDNPNPAESRRLRAVGDPVMVGDDGLSVRFRPGRIGEVASVMRPRQAAVLENEQAETL